MTQLTNWITSLMDRLSEQFPKCGFAYAYESVCAQHVIELSDADTLTDDRFREQMIEELTHFEGLFAGESILFTDQESDAPLELPIVYATKPRIKQSWFNQLGARAASSPASWTPIWAKQLASASDVMKDVVIDAQPSLQPVTNTQSKTTVVGDYSHSKIVRVAGEYNYGMAA